MVTVFTGGEFCSLAGFRILFLWDRFVFGGFPALSIADLALTCGVPHAAAFAMFIDLVRVSPL